MDKTIFSFSAFLLLHRKVFLSVSERYELVSWLYSFTLDSIRIRYDKIFLSTSLNFWPRFFIWRCDRISLATDETHILWNSEFLPNLSSFSLICFQNPLDIVLSDLSNLVFLVFSLPLSFPFSWHDRVTALRGHDVSSGKKNPFPSDN